MATTLGFKDLIDLPMWQHIAPNLTASAAGSSLACDLRNNEDRDPYIYNLLTTAIIDRYHVKNNGWERLATPALAGTFGAGAGAVFAPAQGPRGTIAAGASTTSIPLTTALPASVGPNQLANRGDGRGYKIRIIGNAAGSSGKTEERLIVANTGPSTTPTLTLDSALTFTPANGDAYEILSGRVYLLSASTLAAGIWKYYDIATNSYSGNLATTNLVAAVGTDTVFYHPSESYVPSTRAPGDGMLGNLTATASAATTLTGHAATGDSAVLLNEYRNFQIRIVTDTAIPTAVGQRRRIVSHTAGASPVYTVSAWSVTPSATCTYVIENWDDNILCWTSVQTQTYNYSISGNAWDASTTWAVPSSAHAAGSCMFPSFGIVPEAGKNARQSYVYRFRGGATATVDLFDVAGAATGAWTAAIAIGGGGQTFGTGTSGVYNPVTQNGQYGYMNKDASQTMWRFDVLNRVLEPYAYLLFVQSTAKVGATLAITTFIDGATKLSFLIHQLHTLVVCQRIALQR